MHRHYNLWVSAVFLCFLALPRLSHFALASPSEPEREQRLTECRECHPAIFGSWLSGPHGHSGTALNEFRATVLADPELHGPVKVAQAIEADDSGCHRCHAPKNLFEHFYKPKEPDAQQMAWSELPQARTSHIASGVDCLSCHVAGREVLGRSPLGGTKTPAKNEVRSCNPIPSAVISGGEFCYVCHAGPASEWLRNRTFLSREQRERLERGACYNCHADTVHSSETGEVQSWAARRLQKYRALISSLQASIVEHGVERFLVIRIPAPVAAHPIPSQSVHEILFSLELPSGPLIVGRLNIKRSEDERFRAEFPGKEPPGGVVGMSIDGTGRKSDLLFPLPHGTKVSGLHEVAVKYKAQYWLPDSVAQEFARLPIE